MLYDMYDAIKCVLSMFMIYECNVCACKLISCLAEENKSLITGDNEILTAAGEVSPRPMLRIQESLIVEDEKSLLTAWGLKILGDLWGF